MKKEVKRRGGEHVVFPLLATGDRVSFVVVNHFRYGCICSG